MRIPTGGQDDCRTIPPAGERFGNGKTIVLAELHVQQHAVRSDIARGRERGLRVLSLTDHGVATVGQDGTRDRAEAGVIVNNQNGGGHAMMLARFRSHGSVDNHTSRAGVPNTWTPALHTDTQR